MCSRNIFVILKHDLKKKFRETLERYIKVWVTFKIKIKYKILGTKLKMSNKRVNFYDKNWNGSTKQSSAILWWDMGLGELSCKYTPEEYVCAWNLLENQDSLLGVNLTPPPTYNAYSPVKTL